MTDSFIKRYCQGNGIPYTEYKDGEPCKHAGCLNHISHPCEVCGRIGASGYSFKSQGVVTVTPQ